jgi:hypothetical protein
MTLVPATTSGDPAAGTPDLAPSMRASDADRAATVWQIQDAVARGLLTPDEGSDRMRTAFATRYVRDLRPLTADCPAGTPARAVAPGWRPLAAMAIEQLRVSLSDASSRDVRPGRAALALAVVVALFFLVGAAAGELLDLDFGD